MAVFDPFDTPPVYEPARGVTRMGDQTAPIGNDSARLRREGTPRSTKDWDRLMRSTPSAR